MMARIYRALAGGINAYLTYHKRAFLGRSSLSQYFLLISPTKETSFQIPPLPKGNAFLICIRPAIGRHCTS